MKENMNKFATRFPRGSRNQTKVKKKLYKQCCVSPLSFYPTV